MAVKYPWETEQQQEQPTYKSEMLNAARKYLNRPAFQYDLNTDPLYNQYQQKYMRQGRLAMMDSMGQAAANNGGYGTSYGQMAGQQAYNSQIQQLNDRIPELYQIALDRYQNVGADLLNRMQVAGQMMPYDPGEGGGSSGGRRRNDLSGDPTYSEIAKAVNSAAYGDGKNVRGALDAIQKLKTAGSLTENQANVLTQNIRNTQNGVNIKDAPTAEELRRMHN